METIHTSNSNDDEKEWWFFATPAAGFNDLYEQVSDDEYKYQVYYLRQAIPVEWGYGFFETLLSIYNRIYYKKYGKYPKEEILFNLGKEYLWTMFSEWKIKIKLLTPFRWITTPREWGGTYTDYTWINPRIYDKPDQWQDLLRDLQERFDQLSSSPDDLRSFYGWCIITVDPSMPFWDEATPVISELEIQKAKEQSYSKDKPITTIRI